VCPDYWTRISRWRPGTWRIDHDFGPACPPMEEPVYTASARTPRIAKVSSVATRTNMATSAVPAARAESQQVPDEFSAKSRRLPIWQRLTRARSLGLAVQVSAVLGR
jgi:hypothetical protein